MFRTLYSRIAAVLFTLVLLMGYVVYSMVLYSSEMYQQELTQKLNAALAKHIVNEETLLTEQQVNQKALKSLFHWLMVINPSIELYLLNAHGKILAFSAPEGHVKRQQVSLLPIKKFLSGKEEYPLTGDDPRATDDQYSRQKVFSAAVIPGDTADKPAGYLYVILEGEVFDSITDRVKGSYILRFTTTGLGASLLLALAAGLTAFALLTHRLRMLTRIMSNYGTATKHTPASQVTERYPVSETSTDEIDQLGIHFNQMADRIDQQLKELAQNDAKRREMVANVSHDLRTPLTSLHGYLETLLLKDNSLSVQERRQYLQVATAQSMRLRQLIEELFELAKLDSSETMLNIEPFSLTELAHDIMHKFKLEAEKRNISIQANFVNNLPFAYGDIGLIQRVLDNLIENALRYTPAGGRITLSLADAHDNIIVKVADTGRGIPANEIDHIFDRFYRLEKNRAASATNAGLGLSIAKRIIDLHGSTIQAASKPDKGTTFSFSLPTYQFN
ncbi:MAG TPA: HAMP domain-containing histidine kinase [Gammaproteobacteria bacterium]|nr:HAMP domain-containing histidine kinase [Gammaproteobacteria bacterium]